jgi:hypothetical protein
MWPLNCGFINSNYSLRLLSVILVPCERRGKGHRRARLSDVLAYKETRAARATELVRMREAAADGSLYDIDLSDQMLAHFVDAP